MAESYCSTWKVLLNFEFLLSSLYKFYLCQHIAVSTPLLRLEHVVLQLKVNCDKICQGFSDMKPRPLSKNKKQIDTKLQYSPFIWIRSYKNKTRVILIITVISSSWHELNIQNLKYYQAHVSKSQKKIYIYKSWTTNEYLKS